MACANWGSDLCTGGSEKCDCTYAGPNLCSHAFDDSDSTFWDSCVGFPHYIGYKFASAKQIERLRMLQYASEYCQNFEIQGSNTTADDADWDLKSWTTLKTVTDGTTSWQAWEFTNTTAYQYIRCRATAGTGNGSYWGVYEIEMFECQFTGSFSGYVYEQGSPVDRTLYLYRRDTGAYVDTTTSSGDGSYSFTTTNSGPHFIVCLDDEAGEDFNDLVFGNVIPTTVSG